MTLALILFFSTIALGCIWLLIAISGYLDTDLSHDPRGIWRSRVSDDEFDHIMDAVFSDPNMRHSRYSIDGGGYSVWIANEYYAFAINGVGGFSVLQKRRFFKRLEQFKETQIEIGEDPLKLEKIRSAIREKDFTKALESKLDEWN